MTPAQTQALHGGADKVCPRYVQFPERCPVCDAVDAAVREAVAREREALLGAIREHRGRFPCLNHWTYAAGLEWVSTLLRARIL